MFVFHLFTWVEEYGLSSKALSKAKEEFELKQSARVTLQSLIIKADQAMQNIKGCKTKIYELFQINISWGFFAPIYNSSVKDNVKMEWETFWIRPSSLLPTVLFGNFVKKGSSNTWLKVLSNLFKFVCQLVCGCVQRFLKLSVHQSLFRHKKVGILCESLKVIKKLANF